jgi:hypothetical protein
MEQGPLTGPAPGQASPEIEGLTLESPGCWPGLSF